MGDFVVAFLAIFVAELPDKTMLATLALAVRWRRPLAVWLGVSVSYCAHMLLAVLAGSLVASLPERPVRLVVGAMFLVGAALAWRGGRADGAGHAAPRIGAAGVAVRAAGVIAVAEFADITQLATAGLVARGAGAWATWCGAALAVVSVAGLAALVGDRLRRRVPLARLARAGAVVFALVGVVTLVGAR
jgi:putative Ca2+/H+ antiporter (TMEM165/GDT1 family)